MQTPTQALHSVKDPNNIFDWNPKWARTLLSLIYFSWDIHRDTLHKQNFKYQSWYLTSCSGLEVEKPTQVHQLVKGPANNFDWSPKWVRTLLSLIYFSWDIYRDPCTKENSNIKVDIRRSAVGLRCRNPPGNFIQLKAWTIPLIYAPKWGRTLLSLIYFS